MVEIIISKTTSQTVAPVNSFQVDASKPAFVRMIFTVKARKKACPIAANRIIGGYTPGKVPPIANLPHGTPHANANWKSIVISTSDENTIAATCVIIHL